MKFIPSITHQGCLSRQLQDVINGIFVAYVATITEKQPDGYFLCKSTIILNKRTPTEQFIRCKALYGKHRRASYAVGDRVFIIFTDYNQYTDNKTIDVVKQSKHFITNGYIICDAVQEMIEEDEKTRLLGKGIDIVAEEETPITIKNNNGTVGEKIDTIIDTINTEFKAMLSSGTCGVGPVTFPQLDTAIQKLTDMIKSLKEILA